MKQVQSNNIFRTLDQGPFITITQPSHFTSTSLVKDRIYFKNSFKEAQRIFKEKFPDKEFDSYSKELIKSAQDDHFWIQGSNGISIIVSSDGMYMSRLGTKVSTDDLVKPTVVVEDVPYLLPLIKDFQDVGHYYLLGLNRDSFRVLEVVGDNVFTVDLPDDAPVSMETFLDDHRDTGSLHYKSHGQASLSYHGHGGAKDERDLTRNSYFNIVDRYLRDSNVLDKSLPIRLFTLNSNKSHYQNISKLNNFDTELGIVGSPQDFDKNEVDEHVRILNHASADRTLNEINNKYLAFRQSARVSETFNEIVDVVDHGNIDSLIINIDLLDTPDVEVNQLVIKTLQHKGAVYVVNTSDFLPAKKVIALTHYREH